LPWEELELFQFSSLEKKSLNLQDGWFSKEGLKKHKKLSISLNIAVKMTN